MTEIIRDLGPFYTNPNIFETGQFFYTSSPRMNERIHLLRVDGRPIIAQSITVSKNVPGRELVKMRVESKRQTSLVRG